MILESFARLERALRSLLDPALMTTSERNKHRINATITQLSRTATEIGAITRPEAEAIQDLSALRNVVAHQPVRDLDRGRALTYAATVADLLVAIGETH